MYVHVVSGLSILCGGAQKGGNNLASCLARERERERERESGGGGGGFSIIRCCQTRMIVDKCTEVAVEVAWEWWIDTRQGHTET